MATIPRIAKKPEPPKPTPAPVYSIEEMRSFGWIYDGPISPGAAVPRAPDPRIPSGIDLRISRKDET